MRIDSPVTSWLASDRAAGPMSFAGDQHTGFHEDSASSRAPPLSMVQETRLAGATSSLIGRTVCDVLNDPIFDDPFTFPLRKLEWKRRRIVAFALAGVVALVACTDDPTASLPATIVGAYDLVTWNGRALPTMIDKSDNNTARVTEGTLIVHEDGTFRAEWIEQPDETTDEVHELEGTYELTLTHLTIQAFNEQGNEIDPLSATAEARAGVTWVTIRLGVDVLAFRAR